MVVETAAGRPASADQVRNVMPCSLRRIISAWVPSMRRRVAVTRRLSPIPLREGSTGIGDDHVAVLMSTAGRASVRPLPAWCRAAATFRRTGRVLRPVRRGGASMVTRMIRCGRVVVECQLALVEVHRQAFGLPAFLLIRAPGTVRSPPVDDRSCRTTVCVRTLAPPIRLMSWRTLQLGGRLQPAS